ncbi:unnamed protein product [Dovyalis caffra]|uniref:J domain-containing protein n=1 Tax=Dovyalis caffra TaxID=77055 RepID=A0AAV1R690_9ROSI|nr:unnamed protein product [Dovyalis caffra]
MQIPRWRNVLMLKNSLVPASSQSMTTKTHLVSIHTTPITCQKWKSKRGDELKWEESQSLRLRRNKKEMKLPQGMTFTGSEVINSGESYMGLWMKEDLNNNLRYSTRQKRADAKKALKNLLYNSGASRSSFEVQNVHLTNWTTDFIKCSGKLRRESFSEDFGDPEPVFQAAFGSRWYTWSNNKSFQSKPSGFEWRGSPKGKNQRYRGWDASSETEFDNALYSVGSRSDRTILGLPPTGPLKIEDVKNAFRLSALKWHPDKHQDALQTLSSLGQPGSFCIYKQDILSYKGHYTGKAVAEEKFKLCVDAYKSLCDALA